MGFILTLVILGLVCILVEVFLPGGVLGLLGLLLIAISVVRAYRVLEIGQFVLFLFGFVAAGGILFILAIKVVPKTAVGKTLFLRSTQKGYDVSVAQDQEMVGKEGIALSYLRPAGVAEIDGKRVNVVSEGEYIEKSARIRVSELRDNQLVVRKVDSQQPANQT